MNQNDFNNNQPFNSTDPSGYSAYNTPYQQTPARNPQIDSYVDSAFSKGLAATIMAWFPITSIIAIIMGGKALTAEQTAQTLAASSGTSAGGKCVAAKILGKIGKIGGIAMTVFWAVYILLIIGIMGAM